MPVPSAFATASFAAQRAASDSSASAAIGHLARREHAPDEPLAVPFHQRGNAADFNEIDTNR